MADKKFTVLPGDEIIITVPKRQPTANQILMRRPPAPKAMVRPRRLADSFPRRLKKSGVINFFDTLQIKSGENWINKNLYVMGEVSWIPDIQTGTKHWLPSVEPLTDAEIAQMQSPLTTSESLTGARKIAKVNSNVFPITIIGQSETETLFIYENAETSENWTDEGLNLTDAELSAPTIAVGNLSLTTGDVRNQFHTLVINPAAQKITTVYDFNSDPVLNFRLKRDAQIYLLPKFQLASGRSKKNLDGLTENWTFLNFIHRYLPRYFDAPNAILETLYGEIEAYNRMTAITPTRTFNYNFYFNDPTNPSSPTTGGAFHTDDEGFYIQYSGIFGNGLEDRNFLTGIIKQNGATYYFWNTGG